MESVVTQRNIALAGTVLITSLISGGENQEEHKCGETMVNVVSTTTYQTAQLLSVILTERTRAVVVNGMESVVTRINIVLVTTALITSLQSGGENQEAHKCGGTTESVEASTIYQTVQLLSVILTERTHVVMARLGIVVIQLNIALVGTVLTTSLKSGGENQEVSKCGETTESVVSTTPYRTAQLLSVILTERTRAVVVNGMESVVTRINIVLVTTALITSLQSGGENQEAHKCGGTTESVEASTIYQMVRLLSVILTGRTRAVVINGMESVVTRDNIVLVSTAQITSLKSGGENQEVRGGTTENVVWSTSYQTVKLLNVTLTGITRVVVVDGMESVVTRQSIVLAGAVLTTSLRSGGENQEVHKCGETMVNVVNLSLYQTAQLLSVTLTARTRVVVVHGVESVVTRQNIVLAGAVLTTSLRSGGENQEVHKCGETMVNAVNISLYQTAQQLSVTLTGRSRVAVIRMESAAAETRLASANNAQTSSCLSIWK